MKIPESKYYRHWLAALTAVLTIFIVLLSDTRYSVPAMLKLEFAQTQEYFFSVKNAYHYRVSLLDTYMAFDFAFIVAFTALFCLSVPVLCDIRRVRPRSWYYLICCLPGLLDVTEDIMMLKMLHNNGISNNLFNVFIAVALTKWIIVLPCIAMAVVVLLYPIIWKKIEK